MVDLTVQRQFSDLSTHSSTIKQQNVCDTDKDKDKFLFIIPRVVASYTTLPSRYEVLKRSILSLKNQTHKLDAIYLTVPERASRLDKEYPPIPKDLSELCIVLSINIDYGPITKIYGALIAEKDPNTVIISCDDDVFFAPNYIEVMLKHHTKYPRSCICGTGALIGKGLPFISIVSTVSPFHQWKGFTGFEIDKNGRCVDLIFGVAGVLYTREMFPPNESLYEELLQYSLKDQAIFHNDDVLISGHLSKKGIERRVFFDIPNIHHNNGKDALSSDLIKMIIRLNTSIQKVKEYGFFPNMEEVSLDETPTGRIIIILLLTIIIIILCFYLYKIL